jgi:hypothetical protein
VSAWDVAFGTIMAGRVSPLRTRRELAAAAGVACETFAYPHSPDFSGCFDRVGDLKTTDEFVALEQSEKAAISFRLGSGFAKVVAETILGIPHLLHVKPFLQSIVSLTSGSGRRPDFLGRDARGDWHVIEAKGYSRPSRALFEKAKGQAEAVASIQPRRGRPRQLATRSVAMAELLEDPLSVVFEDPPEDSRRSTVSYLANDRSFLGDYYAPIAALRQYEALDERLVSGLRFRGGRLPGSAVWLGAEESLFDEVTKTAPKTSVVRDFVGWWFDRWRPIRLVDVNRSADAQAPLGEDARASVGLDGLVLIWDEPLRTSS